MNQKPVIYSSKTCPPCHQLKAYFRNRNIEYEERDILDGNNAQEALEKSGVTSVPVIDLGSEVVTGFNRSRLDVIFG